MTDSIRFTKMHGLGNDFMVIDAINQKVDLNPERIAQWGDRHFGIGFDQLLIVENSSLTDVDFRYRIFNCDGSEVEQCGNGARCFARFVEQEKLSNKNPIRVETSGGIISLQLVDESVCSGNAVQVDMGAPVLNGLDIPLSAEASQNISAQQQINISIDGKDYNFSVISMGNPHAVLHVQDLQNMDIDALGTAVQKHLAFPQSVNVGFMEITSRSHMQLRVYERGVGETLACGTGACAAMVAARLLDLIDENATVSLPGGDLQISWQGDGEPVLMTGPTERVFEGTIKF